MRALPLFLTLLAMVAAATLAVLLDPHARHHGMGHAAPGLAGILFLGIAIARWRDRGIRFSWRLR
ncbi:MAG TPA: hypothetical protein VFH47_01780 [Candidatus Thermoplasmatota archaeon]|nr:hypothetical protein [Candidatus Thermoplasmatota archaeon]